MSRWHLPRPEYITNDSELFLVNVLVSSLREVAIHSMGEGATPEECHQLMMMLMKRGHDTLLSKKAYLSEMGVDNMLESLRKELGDGEDDDDDYDYEG